MNEPCVIKILIRSQNGGYLASEADLSTLTTDLSKARIFDCLADHIFEPLKLIHDDPETVFVAVPVVPKKRYETCDGCGAQVLWSQTVFYGSKFFCPECKSGMSARHPDP
jgi:predicted RNA-binding Zn-ribbon protein involved in translation (DUF1610 family)